MGTKLKIWAGSNQDTGVQFFRINQPSRFIAEQKLAKVHTMPFYGQQSKNFTSPEFMKYFDLESKWANVLFSTLGTDQYYLALLLGMKEYGKCKLVIDLDDDILSTHTEPNNPAYSAYNDPNARHAEYAQFCLMNADLLVVSTEYLKEKYRHINPNIVVIPNCIDDRFYKFKNQSDEITIGYAGSASHQKDWEMIEPVLKNLKIKYGVKIKLLGPMHTTIANEQVPWVEMLKYPEQLAKMGFTIGVAPVKDSLMNRAKSSLRWMEYSTYNIPCVASDVVPFRGIDNVLLATEPEEWYDQLEKLILDKKLRTKLGKMANMELKEKNDPNYWSRELHSAIQSLFI